MVSPGVPSVRSCLSPQEACLLPAVQAGQGAAREFSPPAALPLGEALWQAAAPTQAAVRGLAGEKRRENWPGDLRLLVSENAAL